MAVNGQGGICIFRDILDYFSLGFSQQTFLDFLEKVLQKSLINDRLPASKVFWKFRIATIYNFAIITREICYFLKK